MVQMTMSHDSMLIAARWRKIQCEVALVGRLKDSKERSMNKGRSLC